MRKVLFLPLLAAMVVPALAQTPKGDVIAQCEGCHGASARGQPAETPRLNGQRADYLLRRLNDLTIPGIQAPRSIEAMWSNSHKLDEATRQQVAAHFSQQAPTNVLAKSASPSAKNLYERGLASAGIPACQACHGNKGEGGPATPRLAGQRKEYLSTQLWAFNLVARIHGPMNNTALKLMADQIESLASYMAGP